MLIFLLLASLCSFNKKNQSIRIDWVNNEIKSVYERATKQEMDKIKVLNINEGQSEETKESIKIKLNEYLSEITKALKTAKIATQAYFDNSKREKLKNGKKRKTGGVMNWKH